jgi:hypothetical protein
MVKKLSHAHDFTGCPLKIETNTWQCGRIPRNPGGALVQNAIQMIVLHSSNNAENKQNEIRKTIKRLPCDNNATCRPIEFGTQSRHWIFPLQYPAESADSASPDGFSLCPYEGPLGL